MYVGIQLLNFTVLLAGQCYTAHDAAHDVTCKGGPHQAVKSRKKRHARHPGIVTWSIGLSQMPHFFT